MKKGGEELTREREKIRKFMDHEDDRIKEKERSGKTEVS